MIYIGIDPGASGAVAVLFSAPPPGRQPQVFPLSQTEAEIADLFRAWGYHTSPDEGVFAVIEKVHAFPKQGVSSTFKFGMSYGFLRACLACFRIPFVDCAPRVWQKDMRCSCGGDKRITRERAQELYPELKPTNRTADALLIATWARTFSIRKESKRDLPRAARASEPA